jgi:WD40 repeat protein
VTDEAPLFNPFPGLRPFEPDEEHLFFGREGQSGQLLRRLRDNRLVALVGASGSGKSSLIRAGLLPLLYGGLLGGAGSHWRIAMCSPGGTPLRNLAHALCTASALGTARSKDDDQFNDVDLMEVTLRRSSFGLVDAVQLARLPQHEQLVIIIDQFEELFRFADLIDPSARGDDANALVRVLIQATRQRDLPIYIVLGMRSDFIGDCARFHDLPETVMAGLYLIPRMTREECRAAIEKPIRVGGGRIAPRLVSRLLNDTGDNPDELPVLQHALMRTWEQWHTHCGDGSPVDLADYEHVGGMAGALSRHADDAYDKLPDEQSRTVARLLFQCLTSKDRDGRETRHPVTLKTIEDVAGASVGVVSAVVEHFREPGRAFLVPPARVPIGDESIIDISHESLIRCWPRLTRWAAEEAEAGAIYRRIAEDAALNAENQQGLWRDPELQVALKWRDAWKPNVHWAKRYNPGFDRAMGFLDRSRAVRDKQRRRVGAIAAVVFCAIVAFAVRERMSAEAIRKSAEEIRMEAKRTQSVFLAPLADERARAGDMGTALLLALARPDDSTDAVRPNVPRAEMQIATALRGLRENLVLPVNGGVVWRAAFSPDGKLVITASTDGIVRIWSAETGDRIGSLAARDDSQPNRGSLSKVYSAEFSGDGKMIVTASADKAVRVWDVATRRLIKTFDGNDSDVYGAAFSPDGKRIVSASADGKAHIFDVESGQTIGNPLDHTYAVTSARFSPDGRSIVSSSADGYVWIWDAENGANTAKWFGSVAGSNDPRVTSAAYSPDGRRIVSSSLDTTAAVWDAETRQEVRRINVGQRVENAEFSPNGKRIVTASDDGVARIWDIESGAEVGDPFAGHTNPAGGTARVLSAAFSRDGRFLVTASDDETARVWSVEPATGPLLVPKGGPMSSAAFSPNGARVVTTSDDGSTTIWAADTGALLMPLPARHSAATSATYSFDGKLLATTYADGQTQIWDAETGVAAGEPLRVPGRNKRIYSAAFSHDGKLLLTASDDGDVRIWDVGTRQPAGILHANGEPVRTAVFRRDDRQILTAGRDRVLRAWDAAKHEVIEKYESPFALRGAAFSPDGKLIVAASFGGLAQIWDVGTRSRRDVGVNNGVMTSAVFSPDGKRILTASADLKARIWDVVSGEALAPPFAGDGGQMVNAAFSADGRHVVTASSRGARVWPVAPDAEALRELARKRAPRCLTSSQLAAAFLAANPDWCHDEKKWPDERPAAEPARPPA